MKINHDLMQAASAVFKTINADQQTIKNSGDTQSSDTALNIADMSEDSQAAIKLAQNMGVTISQQDAEVIDQFMGTAAGTTAQKLMALTTVIQKNLPLSGQIISDLHSARRLSLADFLVADKSPPAKQINNRNVEGERTSQKVNQRPQLAALDQLLDNLLDAVSEQLSERAKADTLAQPQDGLAQVRTRDNVRSETEQMQLPIDLEQALANPEISELVQALAAVVTQEAGNDLALSSVQPAAMLLQETITPKLIAVKENFEQFKRQTLTTLAQLSNPQKPLSAEQRAVALNKLIDQLDQAIMKSEIGLYIDIKAERDLLRQSGQLADARQALTSGQLQRSEQIVQDVVKVIDEMTFKPTIQKAIAVGNPLNISSEEVHYNDIVKWAKTGVEQFSGSEKSVASLTQYLRRLGVNHETEIYQKVFGSAEKNQATSQKSLENLKSMLLQLAGKGEEGKEEAPAQKLLSHINGQQINLKINDKSQVQTLLLNVPMSMQGHISDVKVFIKSQADDLKADWQNFNMFFVLDTKKLGDIGIKVAAIDKKVRIDIYNDRSSAQAEVAPLTAGLKDYVEQVGFSVSGIHFAAWGQNHPNTYKAAPVNKAPTPNYQPSEKGFDFTI